jgi:hypothetical protein
MPVDLHVLPRPNLSPAGYRRLGRAVRRWLAACEVEEIDADALADLSAGTLPRPGSVRPRKAAEPSTEPRRKARSRSGKG